jgi:Zn-dependent protease with chaperone function
VPAHPDPPSADAARRVPLPLLLLAALLALLALMLVIVGTPVVVAVGATALLGAVHVARAEHVVLRDLRARVALPGERGALRAVRVQVSALCAAAGVPEPELLVGGEGVAPATAVARSRRTGTIVLAETLLALSPADRAAPLARAVADLALGDAVVRTIAGAPAAVGATLLTRLLLAPGARRREDVADRTAARLVGTARSGTPNLPAVPYREFVKA